MKKLHLSDDLALPVDAATQTFLVVGKRGSGKSTTAARIVEQLLAAKVPVVVLDPVDSWYGLKASRDGKGAGFPVYVFGGRHKDVDLEPGAGALIAEFLCEHRAPLVLSCKHLSGLERSRFMVDFALTLYRKWTAGVLHLVLEEAHELAPQAPPRGEKAEEMLGAFKRLWKLGRSSGIGGTAITQRPASLHKDITTQSEILVVHRTIGPQDVEAVRQWIKYHHQGEEILPELATLKTGEAFVWGPEFPEEHPIGLRRVQILPRETFDSASTPKAGEQRTEPKELAPVDLERLQSKMAATIERAKAEDPRELRKTITELRQKLTAAEKVKPATAPAKAPRVVERAVLKDAQVKRLESVAARVDQVIGHWSAAFGKLQHDLGVGVSELLGNFQKESREIKAALAAARAPQEVHHVAPGHGAGREAGTARPAPVASRSVEKRLAVQRAPRVNEADGGRVSRPQQAILDALAYFESVGVASPSRRQVALVARVSSVSSGYEKNVSTLRTNGFIDYPGPNVLRLTETGRAAAAAPEVPPTIADLQDAICARVSTPQAAILRALIAVYPQSLGREELAARANQSDTSSGFEKNVSTLKSLGLIHYPSQGTAAALPVLFLEGA